MRAFLREEREAKQMRRRQKTGISLEVAPKERAHRKESPRTWRRAVLVAGARAGRISSASPHLNYVRRSPLHIPNLAARRHSSSFVKRESVVKKTGFSKKIGK